jgi:GNAT superfamily N-acetyltransferase
MPFLHLLRLNHETRHLGEISDVGCCASEYRGRLAGAPPRGFFALARLDGRPVGCGALKIGDGAIGEIKRMWTAPSARGKGVARAVLHKLEALAGEAGLALLRLETNRELREAQTLYRKEGYIEVAPFNDEPYAHHWFEKRL